MSEKILTIGLKSKIITPDDSVMEILKSILKSDLLQEKDILVITSKIVAVEQGRIQKIENEDEFKKLINQEADENLGGDPVILTKKNNIFIPWAGIDRSNAPKGEVVLWPENPYKVAYQYWRDLTETYKIKELGIIISDSICSPLRKGVGAISLGYAGFKGVNDLRGEKDLYGNELKVSQQNIADMTATAAHLVMGEAAEATPFAIVRGVKAQFTNEQPDSEESTISQKDCLFAPLYKSH
ncbi:coenzyme F420-0:L-glutamate ligase [Candidatus Peregrinibacteria bacterium]|nr:coenzyme F420-0:L-glutamate ligase [Candidatus Peregrinibacteria bacterium]